MKFFVRRCFRLVGNYLYSSYISFFEKLSKNFLHSNRSTAFEKFMCFCHLPTYSLLINALLSCFVDKTIICIPINVITIRLCKKIKRWEARLSQGYASVADLIDYKLVDPRSHIRTRLLFLGNFVFQDLLLSHRARRVASV